MTKKHLKVWYAKIYSTYIYIAASHIPLQNVKIIWKWHHYILLYYIVTYIYWVKHSVEFLPYTQEK